MSAKTVWVVVVFVLALMAVPAIGQDTVSAQDEIRAEAAVIHDRVSAVEASQAKAKREALVLQRKVAALGKSQDGLSVRATSLERATVAVGDRLNSVESLSATLDRRSTDSKDRIANLEAKNAETQRMVFVLDHRSWWALILGLMSLLISMGTVISCYVWTHNDFKPAEKPPVVDFRGRETAEPMMDAPVVDEHVTYPPDSSAEPASDMPASAEIAACEPSSEHDDTAVLEMPSHDPSPTSSDLVLVDEAMVRAHRPIRPIPIPMPAHRRD